MTITVRRATKADMPIVFKMMKVNSSFVERENSCVIWIYVYHFEFIHFQRNWALIWKKMVQNTLWKVQIHIKAFKFSVKTDSLFIISCGKCFTDLYQDGGFDGEYAFFFALLAEDSDVKDSNGFVYNGRRNSA